MSLHIGIAGAGLMGRMLAWQLVKTGYRVSVFDKDALSQGSAAGYTAAGMLTPYAEVESAEPIIYELGMRSLDLWPRYIKEFSSPVRYHTQGSLVLAHPHDVNDLHQFSAQVHNKLKPSAAQFKPLNRDQISELEPELSDAFTQGIHLPEEAWVSAEDFMLNSASEIKDAGATWYEHCHVHSVSAHTIKTDDEEFQFDIAIDTRGTGAKPEWDAVRGVRGEVIWLQAPEVNISRLVRLMHPRYRIYLVPLMRDNLYIVGATQIESDDSSPISVRSCLELLSAAYSLHSGFAEARVIKTLTNCRPALVDNLPKVQINDGLIRINGLFRHGYLLAPAITEQVMSWLKNRSHVSEHTVLNIAI